VHVRASDNTGIRNEQTETRTDLDWQGTRPKLKPRILLEDPAKSYHANTVSPAPTETPPAKKGAEIAPRARRLHRLISG
jgi:hypothetical protein